jgi:hypothetical protein
LQIVGAVSTTGCPATKVAATTAKSTRGASRSKAEGLRGLLILLFNQRLRKKGLVKIFAPPSKLALMVSLILRFGNDQGINQPYSLF